MAVSFKKRIMSGTLANSAGIGMALVIQLVSVPILVSAWGARDFGIWMMLTTIPTYFALTDLGFLQAATSDMAMRYAQKDRDQVIRTYQSTSVLLLSICIGVIILAVSTILFLHFFFRSSIGSYSSTIILLIIFASLSLLSRMPLAALRATGQYAQGTIFYDFMVLLEGLSGLLTAYSGGGFEEVVAVQIGARTINMGLMYWLLAKSKPWLAFGTKFVSASQIKALFVPAVAAMAIPVAMAINLQGIVLIVGALLGPIAVAVYTPVRTCSRMALQLVGVVNRASMPEIAKATSNADAIALTQILKLNAAVVTGILLPGTVLFAVFGADFVKIWSNGHISPDKSFVILVAAATFIQGVWYFFSNILLSTNSHVSLSKYILASGVLSLLLSYVAGRSFGLAGIGGALVVAEFFCLLAALPSFLKLKRSVKVSRANKKDEADGEH